MLSIIEYGQSWNGYGRCRHINPQPTVTDGLSRIQLLRVCSQLLINAVVSMGRRNTRLSPAFI